MIKIIIIKKWFKISLIHSLSITLSLHLLFFFFLSFQTKYSIKKNNKKCERVNERMWIRMNEWKDKIKIKIMRRGENSKDGAIN